MATTSPIHNLRDLPDDALIRLKDVLRIIRISRSSWWRGVAAGKYPRPLRPSPRVSVWRYGDILEIARKAAEATNAK